MLPELVLLIMQLQPMPGVTFEVDLWPCEGRPVFEASGKELRLHESPSESSKVVEVMISRPGQRLQFDDTRYQTIRAGRLRVLAPATLTGRSLGAVRRLTRSDYYSGQFGVASLPLKAGDTIEYLQYRAEGTCFVRIAGVTIDADPCPTVNPGQSRIEVEPSTQWWIRIAADGKARGWLLVVDASARPVDRVF